LLDLGVSGLARRVAVILAIIAAIGAGVLPTPLGVHSQTATSKASATRASGSGGSLAERPGAVVHGPAPNSTPQPRSRL
jgi:hypothetical protein